MAKAAYVVTFDAKPCVRHNIEILVNFTQLFQSAGSWQLSYGSTTCALFKIEDRFSGVLVSICKMQPRTNCSGNNNDNNDTYQCCCFVACLAIKQLIP